MVSLVFIILTYRPSLQVRNQWPLQHTHPLPPSLLRHALRHLNHRPPLPSSPPSHSCPNPTPPLRNKPLRVRAIDTAQLFDYESKPAHEFRSAQRLKITIIGFDNFGQFLESALVCQGHTVLAHSLSFSQNNDTHGAQNNCQNLLLSEMDYCATVLHDDGHITDHSEHSKGRLNKCLISPAVATPFPPCSDDTDVRSD